MNATIIRQFEQLAAKIRHEIDKKPENKYRLITINNAIKIFKDMSGPIISKKIDNIKGIGKGVKRRVNEILQTGSLSELKNVKYYDNKLKKIYGITDSRARMLSKKGIRNVKDFLKYEKNITEAQRLSATFYDRTIFYIQRNIIKENIVPLMNAMIKKIGGSIKYEICGSYRRKVPILSDVDIVISGSPREKTVFFQILEALDIIVEFVKGTTKFNGLIKVDENKYVRIDIRICNLDEFAPMILYFTGSKNFNINMRKEAIKRNMTLNEYGLYNKNGKKIQNIKTEKDIFNKLEMTYVRPENRV